ncbi:MAG: carbamoyltransferase [Bacillota bacterium]
MRIIGIGGSDHDLSCCLLEDGEVLIAIEEERLSKEKHGNGVRSCILKSVDYCLEEAGYTYDDIDMYITSDLFFPRLTSRKPFVNKMIKINHHLAHIASCYYTSGFDDAAALVIDGNGSLFAFDCAETVTTGYAKGNTINIIDKAYGASGTGLLKNVEAKENSLGRLYSFFTQICGFGFLEAGKLMGLSSYGKGTYIDSIRRFAKVEIDRQSNLFVEIDIKNKSLKEFVKHIHSVGKNEEEKFQVKADIAYSVQYLLEEFVFAIMNNLYDKTKAKKLCYSGGVALNSVLNGKIKQKTPFEDVFIHPAAGDSGIAIGAALYGYHNIFNKPYKSKKQLTSAYTGRNYSDEEIFKALDRFKHQVTFEKLGKEDTLKAAAESLSKGRIIGWFQGRSEIGPRALGNRSILADPRVKEMKDILNSRVKFRESFRPFAPVVLEERVGEYFETDFPNNPFMLYVGDVKEDKKSVIPAVTHVDGTARLQTIDRETNEMYYDLINKFGELTGVPVILNTSFNIKGKPIVETPYDAIECFVNCDMDDLFIHDYQVKMITDRCKP